MDHSASSDKRVNKSNHNDNFKTLVSQVGGHVDMKILNGSYVCKPLNPRELQFYRKLSAHIHDFVPKFHGTLSLEEDHETNRFMNGRVSSDRDMTEEYIVLENLTDGYKKPCVLDLKMGTRMWGDFATEAKIQSQRQKVQKSTSAKLGVRFCGSQRYSVSKNNFEKLDKYVGRSATEREFRELLANFFFNCGFFRSDIVVKVIDEIRKIRQKLQSLDGYRFYSSSLLIIYEGKQPLNSNGECCSTKYFCHQDSIDFETSAIFKKVKEAPIKVKIIDFANAASPHDDENDENDENVYHEGPDGGFLMGLENLQEILEGLVEDEKQNIRKL